MLTSFSTSQLNKFNINFITATISNLNNLWESSTRYTMSSHCTTVSDGVFDLPMASKYYKCCG